jgi:hypothetical protein
MLDVNVDPTKQDLPSKQYKSQSISIHFVICFPILEKYPVNLGLLFFSSI